MVSRLEQFENVARSLAKSGPPTPLAQLTPAPAVVHPFDSRNIHVGLPSKVKALFDDGHFAEATYHAFKFLDKKVEKYAAIKQTGYKLMMAAFDPDNPKIQLTPLKTQSEIDEQAGFRFIFAGGIQAIRNPRGHEFAVVDDPDTCLDHLAFVSLLLRRLEQSGFK